jgi:hypothetical protein
MKAPDQRIAKLTVREVEWLQILLTEEHPPEYGRQGLERWSREPKVFERLASLGYARRVDEGLTPEPTRGLYVQITQAGELRLLDPQALLTKRA